MTNKELIELYHTCDARKNCDGCPHEHDERCAIDDVNPDTLVQRLEALMTENKMLETQCEAHCEIERKLAKKISKERQQRQKLTINKMQLKAECDHLRDLAKKLWCEKRYVGEDMNVPSKRLSIEELEKLSCPVWVKVTDGSQDGYWCLCDKGTILTPSGRRFQAKDIPNWEFFLKPHSTDGSPTGQKG